MVNFHSRVFLAASFLHAGVASSVFSTPVKTVTISGGTHGNEYTGIWCIKAIEKQREKLTAKAEASIAPDNKIINVFREYPSLSINTLLANPKAYMANRRFIDTDMNREFSINKLQRTAESCSEEDDATCDAQTSLPYESIRAKEIESMFGAPKTGSAGGGVDGNSDIVIDLHTTTANMGITLIVTEGDALMSTAAAYALHKCKTEYKYENVHILLLPKTEKNHRTHLPSVGKHDFTIEVGPTPQGVIRHDIVEQTEAALHSVLEFLHLSNIELENKTAGATILDRLRNVFPDGVPCYQSAPAVGAKELHGKIQWPTLEDNPNFPAAMVHKSLQDRDYQPLRTGDPLFVGLDGTIIPYDGSHGDEVLLMFVNEGGYYYSSSGTGIGVAVSSRFDLETGNNIKA